MKLLRETIRRILQEVYELDDEQIHRKEKLIRDKGNWGQKLSKAAGLQDKSGQVSDREALRIYQQNLQSDSQGKKMIRAFEQGAITILHSIEYQGAAGQAGLGGTSKEESASDWVKKYGKTGTDALSVVAFHEPPTSSIGTRSSIYGNARFVSQAKGIILKGYPVFVGEQDLFTQTLGAVDDKMKAHWKQSGIPKRPTAEKGDEGGFMGMTRLGRLKKVGYSAETILDNWKVVGTFINYSGKSDGDIRKFVADSLAIGLPCNVYGPKGKLLKRHEP